MYAVSLSATSTQLKLTPTPVWRNEVRFVGCAGITAKELLDELLEIIDELEDKNEELLELDNELLDFTEELLSEDSELLDNVTELLDLAEELLNEDEVFELTDELLTDDELLGLAEELLTTIAVLLDTILIDELPITTGVLLALEMLEATKELLERVDELFTFTLLELAALLDDDTAKLLDDLRLELDDETGAGFAPALLETGLELLPPPPQADKNTDIVTAQSIPRA